MRVRVVHRRGPVGRPPRVCNADETFKMGRLHLFHQLRHARGAAGALQATRIHRDATGVVAPVFQPLQALNQNRNDIAGRN